MEKDYVSMSLETHLFFVRIMKEHSLFLMAGFPSKNADYIRKAEWFMMQFEDLLREVVRISDGRVGSDVLKSEEIVTDYTMGAERRTSFLTGIGIDSRITEAQKGLSCGHDDERSCRLIQAIRNLNNRALKLTAGLIDFKEKILREMSDCRLFTFNYPLLIEHILREARMYRSLIMCIEKNGRISEEDMLKTENFWNQIMMEHALFIRGLLDPTEKELICTADEFAMEYCELLEEARQKDCRVNEDIMRKSKEATMRYQEFKTAGTKGILDCKIAGLILPLLADHVLREANHYLRLLGEDCE